MHSIVISHPTGNANTRATLEGFHASGILKSFHTAIASYPDNVWGRISMLPGLSEFGKRSFAPDLAPKTYTYPSKELGRMLATKLGWKRFIAHEKGIFSVDQIYQHLDRNVAAYIEKNDSIDAIYAYEDGAEMSFAAAKQQGLKCFYDLPIGYWRSMHRLLAEERTKNPEWAITLGGFSDSPEKLKRKDVELKLADVIYVASSFTKKTLEDYRGQLASVEVIPYGFPEVNTTRIYTPLQGRKLKILYVGGLSQRKGISYVFDAVKGLENQVELTVVGRGNINECPALKEALAKHTYIPALPHQKILELMAQQDVFVFPSLFEGFGMVITEAMSQGTPAITTNRTCGPDVITHGKDGWIVDTGSAKVIQDLLISILEKPQLLEKVGKAALEKAKSRPWSMYAQELTQSVLKNMETRK